MRSGQPIGNIVCLVSLVFYTFSSIVNVGAQPSVNSWSQVISQMYQRKTGYAQHETCFFPSIVRNKYYSDCYLDQNGHDYLCCASNTNCDGDTKPCQIRKDDIYLPAFISVIGSHIDSVHGEVNGTYILLHGEYDVNAPSPMYQKIYGVDSGTSKGYFLTFSPADSPPRWEFFADWSRDNVILINNIATSLATRLPSNDTDQNFIAKETSQVTNVKLVPYVEVVPQNPILSITNDYCNSSCKQLAVDAQRCEETCKNSRCNGRGYLDPIDNSTCICFSDYTGPTCQYFCAKQTSDKGSTCDPGDDTTKDFNTCNAKTGQCDCNAENDRVGKLCQFECGDDTYICSNHGHCNINATTKNKLCICDKDYFGENCQYGHVTTTTTKTGSSTTTAWAVSTTLTPTKPATPPSTTTTSTPLAPNCSYDSGGTTYDFTKSMYSFQSLFKNSSYSRYF